MDIITVATVVVLALSSYWIVLTAMMLLFDDDNPEPEPRRSEEMLVIKRKTVNDGTHRDTLYVGDAKIRVSNSTSGSVKIAIDAPDHIIVRRAEVQRDDRDDD